LDFILKVCIGVWITIAEEHHIFVVLKGISERGREVKFHEPIVLPDIVFVVVYVRASSVPAYSLELGFFLTVQGHFHTIVKHTITF